LKKYLSELAKIFATFDAKNNQAGVKLIEIDQDVFSAFDRSVIFVVPNKWSKQGLDYCSVKFDTKRYVC